MKRVLVLHGHTENAHVFGRKFADIQGALKDDVEFVFINAPHLLTPIDPQGEPVFSTAEQYASIRNLDPKHPTKHTPRGWFYHTHTAQDAWAVSHSLMYIRGLLEKEGPFQGIMGYSQGGAIAALVAGLLERPDHLPHFKGVKHPPMEFLVGFSSFVVPNPAFAAPKNLKTPTLLVMGSNDAIVIPELTYALSQHFNKQNLRLEIHSGGHFVPRKPEWRKFLIDFFKAFACVSGGSASPLFKNPIGNGNSAFVSSTGIPFRLMPDEEAQRLKRIANQKLMANRRKSWIEVVPKTFWENGAELDQIEEAEETGEGKGGFGPVEFAEGYSVGSDVARARKSSKAIDPSARVHFFEENTVEGKRNILATSRSSSATSEESLNSLGLEFSTPSTPSSYSDDEGTSVLPPSPSRAFHPTIPASILLKNSAEK